jgi:hypothetical protein
MRMPGLNAEASLYSSKGRYRAAPVAHPNVPQEIVTPSQWCSSEGRRRCHELWTDCQQREFWWITDPREQEAYCIYQWQSCLDECRGPIVIIE